MVAGEDEEGHLEDDLTAAPTRRPTPWASGSPSRSPWTRIRPRDDVARIRLQLVRDHLADIKAPGVVRCLI
ncbi:MAG: hypothetical protein ACRDNW_04230 [Trebonia sp.]